MNALHLEQGSSEWLNAKLGVISASNIHKVLAKKGTETRAGYMSELIGQIATQQMDEMNSKSLDWGKQNEAAARAAYEFETNHTVKEIGFIYGPDKRTGCSPDGIIENLNRGLEIKNPFSAKVHVDFLAMDKIKLEYIYQVQFSMWVTGFDSWDFCSYHAKFKRDMLKVFTLERDEKLMERFSNEVGEFVKEMDEMLLKLDLKFGYQWD